MCGIVGYLGAEQAAPIILGGLRRLEYRGYDSAGIAVLNGHGVEVVKAAGKLDNLAQRIFASQPRGAVGIGHTRWATHGAPTEANAHPHTDAAGRLAVVHNGIIENYGALRAELIAKGVPLASETDTELIAQLMGRESGSLEARAQEVITRLEGQYAVVAISEDDPGTLVAFRQGPPLVLGRGEGEWIVASDPSALVERASQMVVLENGDMAVISGEGLRLRRVDGSRIERPLEKLEWDAAVADKGGYRHYMLKEIHEQPAAVRHTTTSFLNSSRSAVNPGAVGVEPERLARVGRVHLIACGTSWHACHVGKFMLERLAGLPTEVDYASEYRYRSPLLAEDLLVVGVSQSGETADTLAAMELAREGGAMLGTICNVRSSSAWRLAEARLQTLAGPEIGVASTKAFTTQLAALLGLALMLRGARGLGSEDDAELVAQMRRLPMMLGEVLDGVDERYDEAVELLAGSAHSLFLGRGPLYPIALEGALKLKEISYLHAEGYPAGEMKHGPIALITEGFPVVAVAPSGTCREKVVSNLMEVKARGAAVIVVAEDDGHGVAEVADVLLRVPRAHPLLLPILAVLPLQILAYRVAVALGNDVDQPRNLAKSVTVE